MTEILSDLHWIEGRGSNIYLWTGEAALALFDTGMPGDVDAILNYITKIGRTPTQLNAILITHADIDHAGGAAALQSRTGATVYAGKQTAGFLMSGRSPQHMPRLVQFFIDRFIKYKPLPESAIRQIAEDWPLPDLDEWQVLATPGHTLDHHSFYNRRRGILIAGDALNTRGGRINCTQKRITADMDAAHKSARRLLRLTPAVIACGHGRPSQDHTSKDVMTLSRDLA